MTGKKRYSRRWTRLIGGLLGLGIVWGFYVSRTSDKEIGAASLHEAKRLFEYTELLPSDEGEIVRHTYYTLSFNSRHKQANWVYYILGSEGFADPEGTFLSSLNRSVRSATLSFPSDPKI